MTGFWLAFKSLTIGSASSDLGQMRSLFVFPEHARRFPRTGPTSHQLHGAASKSHEKRPTSFVRAFIWCCVLNNDLL
jgi:hypothetical protein